MMNVTLWSWHNLAMAAASAYFSRHVLCFSRYWIMVTPASYELPRGVDIAPSPGDNSAVPIIA